MVGDEYNAYEFTPKVSKETIDGVSKDQKSDCEKTVELVLNVSRCCDSIIIEELLFQGLNDLEKRMVQAERDIMLTIKLKPWIELIMEHAWRP